MHGASVSPRRRMHWRPPLCGGTTSCVCRPTCSIVSAIKSAASCVATRSILTWSRVAAALSAVNIGADSLACRDGSGCLVGLVLALACVVEAVEALKSVQICLALAAGSAVGLAGQSWASGAPQFAACAACKWPSATRRRQTPRRQVPRRWRVVAVGGAGVVQVHDSKARWLPSAAAWACRAVSLLGVAWCC